MREGVAVRAAESAGREFPTGPRRPAVLPVEGVVDSHPYVEYIGEINERQKAEFLGQAWALLFPIDWPEPFGLVMIEAMAGGTPVIAFRNGSTPEVIDDGISGFIVNDLQEAVGGGGEARPWRCAPRSKTDSPLNGWRSIILRFTAVFRERGAPQCAHPWWSAILETLSTCGTLRKRRSLSGLNSPERAARPPCVWLM